MSHSYSVIADELVIADAEGKELWRGQPENHPVIWASAIPNSEDGLVLYNPYPADWQKKQWQTFQNLVRVRPNGSIAWWAELPEKDSRYLRASIESPEIRAVALAYKLTLDPNTGRISSKTWTK